MRAEARRTDIHSAPAGRARWIPGIGAGRVTGARSSAGISGGAPQPGSRSSEARRIRSSDTAISGRWRSRPSASNRCSPAGWRRAGSAARITSRSPRPAISRSTNRQPLPGQSHRTIGAALADQGMAAGGGARNPREYRHKQGQHPGLPFRERRAACGQPGQAAPGPRRRDGCGSGRTRAIPAGLLHRHKALSAFGAPALAQVLAPALVMPPVSIHRADSASHVSGRWHSRSRPRGRALHGWR